MKTKRSLILTLMAATAPALIATPITFAQSQGPAPSKERPAAQKPELPPPRTPLEADARKYQELLQQGKAKDAQALALQAAKRELAKPSTDPSELPLLASLVQASGQEALKTQLAQRWLNQITTSASDPKKVGEVSVQGLDALLAQLKPESLAKEKGQAHEAVMHQIQGWEPQSWRVSDKAYQRSAQAIQMLGAGKELESQLTDEKGRPRLAVAKTLAWVHDQDRGLRQFVILLGDKSKASEGDAKAFWELAEAYAVRVMTRDRKVPNWGGVHVHNALAAAQSDAVTVTVLEEWAGAELATGRARDLRQAIGSLRGRFGPPELKRLEAIEQALDQVKH